jgi:hypothetical protein
LRPDEARSKALRAVETRGRNLASAQADQIDSLIRSTLTADDPNCDGSYVAKRTLLTESDAYRSGWKRVVTDPNASSASVAIMVAPIASTALTSASCRWWSRSRLLTRGNAASNRSLSTRCATAAMD